MTRRWPCIVVAMLCCLPALTTSASAEDGYLKDKYGLAKIPLWRTPTEIDEGFSLLKAGQHELAAQRMICTVDTGTRVVGTYPGGSAYRVVVIEGKAKGCTGYVPAYMFISTSPATTQPGTSQRPDSQGLKANEAELTRDYGILRNYYDLISALYRLDTTQHPFNQRTNLELERESLGEQKELITEYYAKRKMLISSTAPRPLSTKLWKNACERAEQAFDATKATVAENYLTMFPQCAKRMSK